LNNQLTYKIFPLGDAALTVDFGNIIDESINEKVIDLFHELQREPLPGMIEAVPAYSSITVYYDLLATRKKAPAAQSVVNWMTAKLHQRLQQPLPTNHSGNGELISIPVCYEGEFAPDLERLARERNISPEEVVRIHTSKPYRVFMLGFLPGFAYMGEVDERIATPRKLQPVSVAAGSVGIAGKQTGIYPLVSPGGWQIIGRTSLSLFNKEKEQITLFKAGDSVQFIPVGKDEFTRY
jgi:inhibitor of KinA